MQEHANDEDWGLDGDPAGKPGKRQEKSRESSSNPSPEETRRQLLKNSSPKGGGGGRSRGSGARSAVNLMSYIVNIIFAALITVGVVFYMCPSKGDVRAVQERFDSFNTSTQAAITGFSTTYATQESVSGVAGRVDTLETWRTGLVIPTVPDYSSFYSDSTSFSAGGNASGNLSGSVPAMFDNFWLKWSGLNSTVAALNTSFQATQVVLPHLMLTTGDCVVTLGAPVNTSVAKGKLRTYSLPAGTMVNLSANASPSTFGYWLINGIANPNSSISVSLDGDVVAQAYLQTSGGPIPTPTPSGCVQPTSPILTYPDGVKPIAPAGVSFFWNSSANTSSYELWVTGNPMVTVNSTGYVWVGNLSANTSYTWKVVAKAACGLSSDSINWTFNTSP